MLVAPAMTAGGVIGGAMKKHWIISLIAAAVITGLVLSGVFVKGGFMDTIRKGISQGYKETNQFFSNKTYAGIFGGCAGGLYLLAALGMKLSDGSAGGPKQDRQEQPKPPAGEELSDGSAGGPKQVRNQVHDQLRYQDPLRRSFEGKKHVIL